MIAVGGYQAATSCVGRATTGALNLMSFSLARYQGMTNGGIYGCRKIAGSTQLSVHAEGRADDIMTGTGSPTTASKWLAEQMRVFSKELGLQGIIHNRRCWFSNTGRDWDPYNGTNPHTNHIHAELTRAAGGSLTVSTIKRILVGPSINGNIAGPILRQGARGTAVKDVQNRLREHGFALSADGVFGPKTHTATVTFQGLAGLTKDGIVGPVTRGRLR